MRILITGIHGFVGSNLVRYLSLEHTLYGLSVDSTEMEGVEKIYSWDELDKGIIPAVDAIIHLAGKAHDVKKCVKEEYFEVNMGLTRRIFDFFLKSSASKFIFFSSVKAAAEKVEGVLTEDVTPSPIGPYGESKLAAEEYILSHPAKGKSVYIFRPCMIHGPGNKGNLNLLFNVVSKGVLWPLGAFENRRTFTSIENVCFVVNGVLTKNAESGIYDVCDDDALSTNEVVEIMCSVFGRKSRVRKIPKCVMSGCAAIGGWLQLPLNPERLRKLTENYIVSNAKIKAALGIEEMPVGACEGLLETVKSFRNG